MNASSSELMYIASLIRKKIHPSPVVTWIIDRNINISNVCVSGCKFCNFHCKQNSENSYITTISQYKEKINELFAIGGRQVLLQGGLNPDLGLDYYTDLFRNLKNIFPELRLHALGPPEIHFLSKKSEKTYNEVLYELKEAGLDSLPGAGAEILSNRVRKIISPGKCSTEEWLEVMRAAHDMGMITSATMMFGHIENNEEIIDHLFYLRDMQSRKKTNCPGFISFTPWTFQANHTQLSKTHKIKKIYSNDYIKLVALSRIILVNIENIQASWLTTGFETAKICLHGGANDLGSIMMEENVVSSAGAKYSATINKLKEVISDAGFKPRLRDQKYQLLD